MINTKDFDSAKDLWEFISPQMPLGNTLENPDQYIYRGQADAKWGLVPSIFRDENAIAKRFFKNRYIYFEDQVFVEAAILNEFIKQCDLTGLRINNDLFLFRKDNLDIDNLDYYYRNPSEWPNKNQEEVMALVQHYGVPTRLLDWSKRSHVAAYFAASTALALKEYDENVKAGTKIAIWVLDIVEARSSSNHIETISFPGSVCSNLAAQQGVFTIVHQPRAKRGQLFQVSLLEHEKLSSKSLYKLTLPISQCKEILTLCKIYGVSSSTLFPGFYGAAKGVGDWLNMPND